MAKFTPNLKVARDNHVLKHVYRMGITTPQVLARLFSMSRVAVRQLTKRLRDLGYLTSHALFQRSTYYRLGPECIRRWGIHHQKTRKLGEQALPEAFAVLVFCTLRGRVIKRLLPEELAHFYPWLPTQYASRPWYVDGNTKRLSLIKVEPTAQSPGGVVGKHLRLLYRLRSIPEFRELEETEDGFQLITLTAEQSLADGIHRAAEGEMYYPAFETVSVPQLLNVIRKV